LSGGICPGKSLFNGVGRVPRVAGARGSALAKDWLSGTCHTVSRKSTIASSGALFALCIFNTEINEIQSKCTPCLKKLCIFTARCDTSAVNAVTQCLSVCLSVRLSVRLTRSWITSKRINISAKFFNLRVATPF